MVILREAKASLFFLPKKERIIEMGKSALIKKIHNAAVNYQKYLAGRTFLYVYDDSVVEIVFKSSSFYNGSVVKTKI